MNIWFLPFLLIPNCIAFLCQKINYLNTYFLNSKTIWDLEICYWAVRLNFDTSHSPVSLPLIQCDISLFLNAVLVRLELTWKKHLFSGYIFFIGTIIWERGHSFLKQLKNVSRAMACWKHLPVSKSKVTWIIIGRTNVI